MTRRSRLGSLPRDILTAALFVLLAAGPAMAHPQQGQAQGFLTGVRHPVSGLDHVLAMICVGVWGAQLGQPAIWLLPVTFPMVMAFGGMLGLMGMRLPGVELAIVVSAILLGLAVLAEWRPPRQAAALIVGFFAIFHGHAHGAELPAGANGLLYSVGFVVATGTLHGIGIGIGVTHRWRCGLIGLRMAGAMVAAAGAFFLCRAIA